MLAAAYNQVHVLRVLADHIGADRRQSLKFVERRNNDDKSAEDLALESQHLECVTILNGLKEALGRRAEHQAGSEGVANYLCKNKLLIGSVGTLGPGVKSNSYARHTSLTVKPQTKSHENLSITNSRSVARNGIKLPPINGKRFVDYSEWNEQQNDSQTNDRKTI